MTLGIYSTQSPPKNWKAHLRFRFESADGAFIAKIDGFIGRNALGELLIKSHPNGMTASFELKLGLDFICDYADVSSAFPDSPQAIRLRFTNGDILLVLGADKCDGGI